MKYLLSIFFLLTSFIVYAQDIDITISQWKDLHTKQEQVAKQTLDMFPSTWQEFIELYGWGNNKKSYGMPFYHRQLNDAEYLYNNRQLINYDLFIQKVLVLACEATWDADHVNSFQDIVQKVLQDWDMCLPHLEKFNENETRIFWQFVLASPAMSNMVPLKEYYEQMAKISHYNHLHLINEAFEYNVKMFRH